MDRTLCDHDTAMLSDELNTALTTIQLALDVLCREHALDTGSHRVVGLAQNAIDRAGSLVMRLTTSPS